MASTQVDGDFDNYDYCECDDGWERDKNGNRKKGKFGGSFMCIKCGGLGLIRK